MTRFLPALSFQELKQQYTIIIVTHNATGITGVRYDGLFNVEPTEKGGRMGYLVLRQDRENFSNSPAASNAEYERTLRLIKQR